MPITSGLLSVDAAVFSSILAGLLLIALFALIEPLERLPVPAARNAAALFRRAFVAVDGFSLMGAVNIGASPVKHPRPLGGLLWLLGALSFVCFTVVLALQRASDNVLQQSSIRLLGAEALAAAASLPWASSGPWGGGLRLRVYATGEPGACAAPLAWSAVGLSAGTWRLAVTPSCGASRVSLMEFVCDPCMPTTAAALDVALNFSCQSLLIEAFAMDANGNVSVAAVPPPLTAASAEAGLLSSVSWTVLPFFSVLESSLADLPPARGFAMTFKDAVATHTALEPDASGLLATVMPAAATVRLHFDFPLQPFYASTQLSEKRPMSALITSIVGLMGVFSFFGKLLTLLDGAPNIRRILSLKRQPLSREPPAPAQVGEVAVESHVGVENPLFARSASQPPEGGGGGAAISAADTAAVWYRESDEEYMWYRNSAGEIAWDLPAGAVLASHPT